MPRVTLKDVAEAAGLSVSTVSLALRGRGKLKSQTVAEIRQLAEQMGYVPDPLLSALAAGRFRDQVSAGGIPLAVLRFPISRGMAIFPREDLAEALLAESRRAGFFPQIFDQRQIEQSPAFFRMLYHRGVLGIVILGQAPLEYFSEPALWRHFCVVGCGRYEHTLPVHTVRFDIFRSVLMVWEKLVALGHRRIGFALGRHATPIEDDEARNGAAMALSHFRRSGKSRVSPYLGEFNDTQSLVEWYQKSRPDAVVGFHQGQYRELVRSGAQFPRDASFVLLNVPKLHRGTHVAGLHQNAGEIARQSISFLDQLVRHNDRGIPERPCHMLIPPQWVDGPTVSIRR